MDLRTMKDKLVNYNKVIIYDMKDEFKHLLLFNNNITNFQKCTIYNKYKKEAIDCDVCDLAVSVYKQVWRFLKKSYGPVNQCYNVKLQYKYYLKLDNEIYLGDSMTSFWGTYYQAKYIKQNAIEKVKEDIDKEIEEFAKLYHTIGNMIPIPRQFNTERSGYGENNKKSDCDFWDLTMQKIKERYEKEDDKEARRKALEELLNPHKENKHVNTSVIHCENWLNHFKTWNEFVEQNFLKAFIAKNENGEFIIDKNGNYTPLVLWKGHSHNSVDMPTCENEFLDYLVLLNTAIKNRNKDIINEIINSQ